MMVGRNPATQAGSLRPLVSTGKMESVWDTRYSGVVRKKAMKNCARN